MKLYNLRLPGKPDLYQLHIEQGAIRQILSETALKGSDLNALDLGGATVYPGLINSHDHLDFNSFPALKSGIYPNYRDWGNDIHVRFKKEIQKVLSIPKEYRIKWGIYKNLLNGFTTVVNHGERLNIEDSLIDVFQDADNLHSTAFEKAWKWKLLNPFKSKHPVVMHVGEGTDPFAENEVIQVARHNKWKKRLVAVHGVAMQEKEAMDFAGLIWCPASNYFLLGGTAQISRLSASTRIVFGTDSTLTGPWNAWEHFRMAINSGQMSEQELFDSLTSTPAKLWELNNTGRIGINQSVDLLVLNAKENAGFSCHNPEDIMMVMHQGRIRMIDDSLSGQLEKLIKTGFTRIMINGSIKYVEGNLAELKNKVSQYYPEAKFPFSIY